MINAHEKELELQSSCSMYKRDACFRISRDSYIRTWLCQGGSSPYPLHLSSPVLNVHLQAGGAAPSDSDLPAFHAATQAQENILSLLLHELASVLLLLNDNHT